MIASVTASNPNLGGDSSYLLSFMPVNSLPSEAVVELVLPAELQLSKTQGKVVSCSGKTNFKSVLDCNYNSLNHELMIKSGLKRNQAKPMQTSIEIIGF